MYSLYLEYIFLYDNKISLELSVANVFKCTDPGGNWSLLLQ